MDALGRKLIYKYHSNADKIFLNHWVDAVGIEKTVLCIILIVSFPAAIFGAVISYYRLSKLQIEEQQLFKLFLMMPIKDLEKPRIKNFLTTGKIGKCKKEEEGDNVDLQIEATLTKTERILQAAGDAVIVFNGFTLKIEVFNAAAEKLFGTSQSETVDKLITDFLPSDVIEIQLASFDRLHEKNKVEITRDSSDSDCDEEEVSKINQEKKKGLAHALISTLLRRGKKVSPIKQKEKPFHGTTDTQTSLGTESTDPTNEQSTSFPIKKADGSLIPVSASFSISGTVCAVFLRDVREIKGYQSLIQQNEMLMEKILPKSIAVRLKDIITSQLPVCIADNFDKVTILFADMVKFTNWSSTMEPEALVSILNGLICTWDGIALRRGIEKIKTIGDCYMAVCGCPDPNVDQERAMVSFAEEMIQTLRAYNEARKTNIEIRVGIHTGPVVAGVIGLSKIMYDIWGPQVSVAAKMESSGVKMAIHVSEVTYSACAEHYPFVPHDDTLLKSGETIKTYLYTPAMPGTEELERISLSGKNDSAVVLSKAISTQKARIKSAGSRNISSASSNRSNNI